MGPTSNKVLALAPPRDTGCVDVPGGPRTESFFAEDLPDVVGHHHRVGKKPGSRGITGDSHAWRREIPATSQWISGRSSDR